MSGPPASIRGAHHPIWAMGIGEPRLVRNVGSMLLIRTFHWSPARRVWMTTSPDENRPYSTSYGFGNTATESIASSGSDSWVRPVEDRPGCPGRAAGPPGLAVRL